MNARKTVTLLIALVLSMGLIPHVLSVPAPRVLTKPVSYPLPSQPEPALLGTPFRVDIDAGADASGWKLRLKSTLAYAKADLINSTLRDGVWRVYFKVPATLSADLYDVNVAYSAGGQAVNFTQPRSGWILEEWPSSLTIAQITDLHEPYGDENVARFAYEANLLHPDVVFTTGDNVDVETISRAWAYLQDSLGRLEAPSYVVPGNHDHSGERGDFYQMFGGRFSYVVVLGNYVIVTLDTGDMGYTTMDEIAFADSVFKKHPGKVKILAFHHPPLSRDEGTHLTTDPGGDLTGDWTRIEELTPLMHLFWIDGQTGKPLPETKALIKMVQEDDVRLIMNGHVHSDMIHVLNGKHWFVTTGTLGGGAVPGMNRGYRIITVTKDGKVSFPVMDPKITYDPPNLTPVGNLDYWYEGPNDGSTTSATGVIRNRLDVPINGKLEFVVSSGKPITDYRWIGPQPSKLEQLTVGKTHRVTAYFDVAAKSEITAVLTAAADAEKPRVKVTLPATYTPDSTVPLTVEASDSGWGVKEVKVRYSYVQDSRQRDLPAAWSPTVGKDQTITAYTSKSYTLSVPTSKGGVIDVQVSATDYAGNTETVTAKTEAPLPVTKHRLRVATEPAGIQVVVKGQQRTTPFDESVEAGTVTIGVPDKATVTGVDYAFKKWTDGEASAVRTINLAADASLTAQYEVVPKKYTLSLGGQPEGVTVTVDGAAKVTPAQIQLLEGSHTLSVQAKATVAGKEYQFKAWSTGAATTELKIDLKADAPISAIYEAVPPPPPPQQGGIPLPAEYALIGVLAAAALLLLRRREG